LSLYHEMNAGALRNRAEPLRPRPATTPYRGTVWQGAGTGRRGVHAQIGHACLMTVGAFGRRMHHHLRWPPAGGGRGRVGDLLAVMGRARV
jgi:hypothetical protein